MEQLSFSYTLELPVFQRAHTGVFSKKGTEKGLVGEIELVGDLRDAHIAALDHGLSRSDDHFLDPALWRFTGKPGNNFGSIFWRDKKLIGIKTDFPLLPVMFKQ
jgi:hypothetical protein